MSPRKTTVPAPCDLRLHHLSNSLLRQALEDISSSTISSTLSVLTPLFVANCTSLAISVLRAVALTTVRVTPSSEFQRVFILRSWRAGICTASLSSPRPPSEKLEYRSQSVVNGWRCSHFLTHPLMSLSSGEFSHTHRAVGGYIGQPWERVVAQYFKPLGRLERSFIDSTRPSFNHCSQRSFFDP